MYTRCAGNWYFQGAKHHEKEYKCDWKFDPTFDRCFCDESGRLAERPDAAKRVGRTLRRHTNAEGSDL